MKRMCIIILMALLLCCVNCVAFGEEFTLRNNVCFGDALQEVISKEANVGVKLEEDPDFDKEYWDQEKWCAVVEVAGIPDTTVDYYFDKSNKLVEMDYTFETAEPYSRLNDVLVRKYGATPYNHTTGITLPGFPKPENKYYAESYRLKGKYAGQTIPLLKMEWTGYSDWFIEENDDSLIHIRHSSKTVTEFDSTPGVNDYYVSGEYQYISYAIFTHGSDEWEKYMNYKDSISNDL